MGSHCRHTPTRKGDATIWVCSNDSSTLRESKTVLKDIEDRWMHFSNYLAPVAQICVVLGQCAHDYMEWFYMISHPFMRPT